jgi:hypothetical protein
MTGPDTVSFQPDPNPTTPAGAGDRALFAPTVAPLARSTPGPLRAEHSTDSNATGVTGGPARSREFPDVPGYAFDAVLGSGGMGVVYRGLDLRLRRLVALKVVHGGGREEAVVWERFARETEALARIEHRNVVSVYSAGVWRGHPYFAMKYVPCGTLAERLPRLRGDAPAAAGVVAKVADGVAALHAAGVLHRDLKPLNILIDEAGEPLVADFSLAMWFHDRSDLTAPDCPVGTRQYMPPEQTLGRKADYSFASDVWALGVILYELLTGRRPFAHDDVAELYRMIREDAPPPMGEAVPAGLQNVVLRCLAKCPADRYPTAAAVAADLRRWRAGGDIPPLRRRGRPGRWLAAVSAGAVLAGVVLVARGGKLFDPDPAPRPVAGRPAGGPPVTFIGERGLPAHYTTPGNFVALVWADDDGYCTVDTAVEGLVELGAGPLPAPATLEAEVAVFQGKHLSAFGLYFGRRGRATDKGEREALFLVTVNGRSDGALPGGNGRAVFAATQLGRPESGWQYVPFGAAPFDHPPFRRVSPPNWLPLRVRVTADAIQSVAAGRPLPDVGMDAAGNAIRTATDDVPGWAHPPDPHLSGGFGLYVRDGRALFRSVRLVPDR